MKIVKLILISFFLLLPLICCDEYFGATVDCDECWSPRPDSADLIIDLTIESPHYNIPIEIYQGHIEDSLIAIDTADHTPYYFYVKTEEYYSVKAEYQVGDRTIIAVDGDDIKTKRVSDDCGKVCWVVVGGILNAELKFDE